MRNITRTQFSVINKNTECAWQEIIKCMSELILSVGHILGHLK